MNPTQQKEMTRQILELRFGDAPGFVRRCAERVDVAEGGQKYYDAESDTMLFETMPLEDLYRYTEEEILDIPNYAAMLARRGVVGSERLAQLAHELWQELAKIRADN